MRKYKVYIIIGLFGILISLLFYINSLHHFYQTKNYKIECYLSSSWQMNKYFQKEIKLKKEKIEQYVNEFPELKTLIDSTFMTIAHIDSVISFISPIPIDSLNNRYFINGKSLSKCNKEPERILYNLMFEIRSNCEYLKSKTSNDYLKERIHNRLFPNDTIVQGWKVEWTYGEFAHITKIGNIVRIQSIQLSILDCLNDVIEDKIINQLPTTGQ